MVRKTDVAVTLTRAVSGAENIQGLKDLQCSQCKDATEEKLISSLELKLENGRDLATRELEHR